MTLDEAIKHAEEKAEEIECKKCANEHKQLSEWLKELKKYRKQKFMLGDIAYFVNNDNYDEDFGSEFEGIVENITIAEDGDYEYSTSKKDFCNKDIGNWVFKSGEERYKHTYS